MEAVDTNLLNDADQNAVGGRGTFFPPGMHQVNVNFIRVWRSHDQKIKCKFEGRVLVTDNPGETEVGKNYVWIGALDKTFDGKDFPDKNRLKKLIVSAVQPRFEAEDMELDDDTINDISGKVIADAEFLADYQVRVKVDAGKTKQGKDFTYHDFLPVEEELEYNASDYEEETEG